MSSLLTFQLNQQQLLQQNNSLPSPPSSFCGDDAVSDSNITPTNTTATTTTTTATHLAVPTVKDRRDSLQRVFNNMTLKEYSSSMPENYTIDHSTSVRHSHVATAAATGGLTIRHHRESDDCYNNKRKMVIGRSLSESYNGSGGYRCHDCGKSYKHPNCLQKHRWEHSEEWELTSKLPLTKHQQVQMLEAAAILISMDKKFDNEQRRSNNDKNSNNNNNNNNNDGGDDDNDSDDEVVDIEEDEEVEDYNNDEIKIKQEEEDDDDESIVIDDDDDDDEDDRMSYASEEIFLEDL